MMKLSGLAILAAVFLGVLYLTGGTPFSVFFYPGPVYAGEATKAVFLMPLNALANSPICKFSMGWETITTSYKVIDTHTLAVIKPEARLSPPVALSCILKGQSAEYPTGYEYWTPPYSDQPRAVTVVAWWQGASGVQLHKEEWEMIVLPAKEVIPPGRTLITNAEACDASEIGNTRCKSGISQICKAEVIPEGYTAVQPPNAWTSGGSACTPGQQEGAFGAQGWALVLGVTALAAIILRKMNML